MTTAQGNVISRHARNGTSHWRLQAENLAPWCRIPGSPLFPGFYLMPNHPNATKVIVKFGPLDVGPDIDAFSYTLLSSGKRQHRNTINVDLGVLDAGGSYFSHSQVCLSWGERQAVTLSFDSQQSSKIYLTFSLSFCEFLDTATYGGVEFSYIVGHTRNRLVELFNECGSDKGTVGLWSPGPPHCYAVDYYRLFEDLQDEEFNFLEIGLGEPIGVEARLSSGSKDAPSLKAWRQFFRKAKLYGYDINDFSFFKQCDAITFQGDQASREDLNRFLQQAGNPQFKAILDDGSHASSHQQISLGALFPSIGPGGMYLIEDLSWQPFDETPKTLDVLSAFRETGKFESPFTTESEAKYLEENVSQVEIYKPNDSEFAVIRKKE